MTLFPGTYRFWVQPRGSGWPRYPIDRGTVEVTRGTTLDLEVPAPVMLTGEIAPGPSTEGLEGSMKLRHDRSMPLGSHDRAFDSFHSSDWPESYEAPVYPGDSFDVVFMANGEHYDYGRLGALTAPLAEDLVIDRETRRDFKPVVETVDVSVTVDGEAPTEKHRVGLALFSADADEFHPEFDSSESTDEFALRLPEWQYRFEATVRPYGRHFQDPFVHEVEVTVPTDGDVVIDVPCDANRARLKGRVEPLRRIGPRRNL